MKVKTQDLIGTTLDWAVAQAIGTKPVYNWRAFGVKHYGAWETDPAFGSAVMLRPYSTDWAQGGPIIERGHIHTWTDRKDAAYAGHPDSYWVAEMTEIGGIWWGPTPLIAAMRCFCASRLGDEVEVPDEIA